MWWNFAKAAFRSLYRDKAYTTINVIGLAIGMACSLVLGSYLHSMLTFDLHHEQHDRIYRVATEFTIDGRSTRTALSSAYLAPVLASDFAEVQSFVRLKPLNESTGTSNAGNNGQLVRSDDASLYWNDVYEADPSVLQLFSHEILHGDPSTALLSPTSAAVNRTFAERHFGTENSVGKVFTLASGEQKTIDVVFSDIPDNSHLRYDLLLSFTDLPELPEDARHFWGGDGFTYLLMPEHYDVESFGQLSDIFFGRYMTEHAEYLNATWRVWLQPLADIHLGSTLQNDRPVGNRYYVYALAAVGFLILVVACINYINLSTARTIRRTKEIGIRKILGASRFQLGLQFVAESVVLSMVAMFVAILLFFLALAITPISELLGNYLSNDSTDISIIFAFGIVLSIGIGLLAGTYPALFMSSITPLNGLLSTRGSGAKKSGLREALVLLQFAISVAVIASTMIMLAQMQFLKDRPTGFDREGKVVVTLRGADLIEQFPSIKAELENQENILGATATERLMGVTNDLYTFFETENNAGETVNVTTHLMPIDFSYIDVMGMEIVEGRNFSPDRGEDIENNTIIVNEAVVRYMNWDNPLGKRMGRRDREVVGVIKDFNFKSLHVPVEPIAIFPYATRFGWLSKENRPNLRRFMIISIEMRDIESTLQRIEETLMDFDSTHPFQYKFLDDVLAIQYLSDERLMRLIAIFAAISVSISCLGLLGLTAYTTALRTKEIGIRKVLGATTFQIIILLSRRILLIIALGSILATSISYFVMSAWLSSFAYSVSIKFGLFIAASVLALTTAFFTVSIQSFRVATSHPVDALRYE